MPKVFVCYSHDDGSWVRSQPDSRELPLVPWLRRKLAKRQIDFWWDEELEKEVGRKFTPIIEAAIDESETAILLLSEDFFSSEYILETELPRILAREHRGEMQVFPIVLGRIDWNQNEVTRMLRRERQLHPSELRPLKRALGDPAEWDEVRSKLASDLAEQVLSFRPKSQEAMSAADAAEEAARVAELDAERKRSAEIEADRAKLEREAERRREEAAARLAELDAERKRAALIEAERAQLEWEAAEARKRAKAAAEELERHNRAMQLRAKQAAEAERQRAAETEKRIAAEVAKAREEERRRLQAEAQKPKSAPAVTPSSPKPGELRTIDLGSGLTLNFRWCPPGRFTMGSPDREPARKSDEGPVEVTLTKGYWMGETPVTQAQYRVVTGTNPASRRGDNLPVEQVSWDDAVEFCRKLSSSSPKLTFALPTEAQWEYACRARTTTPFHFGPTITPDQANFDGNQPYGSTARGLSRQQTTPVGSFPANEWRLRDMHGNVLEWCADWYEARLMGGLDPTGPASGSGRVVRGGSWGYGAQRCRSASRGNLASTYQDAYIGFRPVLLGQ